MLIPINANGGGWASFQGWRVAWRGGKSHQRKRRVWRFAQLLYFCGEKLLVFGDEIVCG